MGSKPSQKVLVVDDEEPILELLKYNLEKQGYEVKTASNGQIAVDVAKKFLPDLVLLDIMMPKMDGVEACRIIRERLGPRCPHVVALTANAIVGDREKYLSSGFDGYLPKPLNVGELREELQRAGRVRRKPS